MSRRGALGIAAAGVVLLVAGYVVVSRASFPSDQTPQGAYARIVLAITEGRPRDCFAYLETQSQWASYTIHDFRAKASALVARSYPEPERTTLLARYKREAEAPDGADIWADLAESRGFIARLRNDLSGVKHVDASG